MRIVIVSKALVVRAYHEKIAELARLGDSRITVVIPQRWGKYREEIENRGYNLIRWKALFNGNPHLHFYPKIAGLLEQEDPDVVHIDEEHYVFVTYQLLKIARKLEKKALFFTWQNIYKKYPFPFSAIERFNLKNADAAIAGNNEAERVLERKGFRKKIFVIPQFGVDEARFCRNEQHLVRKELGLDNFFVVGYVGRLVREKGIVDLVKAVAECGKDVRLVVIGDGPLRNELIGTAGKLGAGGQLVIIDHVPSTEVPRYLNCLDCLALPSLTTSRWKEQFGRVLIEAMACEVPVVGSDSGEIPNVIGDAGLIFKERDWRDLAAKIKMLRDKPELRLRLAKAGRERVLKRYTQKKIAEQTYQVYQWLAGERRL